MWENDSHKNEAPSTFPRSLVLEKVVIGKELINIYADKSEGSHISALKSHSFVTSLNSYIVKISTQPYSAWAFQVWCIPGRGQFLQC